MRLVNERRREEASRLRVYIAAIKKAEATTDAAWADEWVERCRVSKDIDSVFIARSVWIGMLKNWALLEAEKLTVSEAA